MNLWRVEFVLSGDCGEVRDFLEDVPGPHSRKILRQWFEEPGMKVFMIVHHRASGLQAQAQVRQETQKRLFRVNVDKDWRTLEAGCRLMQEDLEEKYNKQLRERLSRGT